MSLPIPTSVFAFKDPSILSLCRKFEGTSTILDWDIKFALTRTFRVGKAGTYRSEQTHSTSSLAHQFKRFFLWWKIHGRFPFAESPKQISWLFTKIWACASRLHFTASLHQWLLRQMVAGMVANQPNSTNQIRSLHSHVKLCTHRWYCSATWV